MKVKELIEELSKLAPKIANVLIMRRETRGRFNIDKFNTTHSNTVFHIGVMF